MENEDRELAYLHTRIDQLINQVALEIGLLEIKVAAARGESWAPEYQKHTMQLVRNRFLAADKAAGEPFGMAPRMES